jgi:hypothetical protein
MNTHRLLRIEMECPYCEAASRLKIESINRKVRCEFCEGEFLATTTPIDVVRLRTGCSVTKQMYTWACQRDIDHMYRVAHLIMPLKIPVTRLEPVIKARSLEITKFDLAGVRCPGCGDRGIDFCSCGAWACQGGARRVPGGRYNHCPTCDKDAFFAEVVFEVPVFNRAPLKAVNSQPPSIARPALPAASSPTKVRWWK